MAIAGDISVARQAKRHLAEALEPHPDLNGVGIQPVEGGYALIVNVLKDAPDLDVPREVDGVDVRVEVTGPGFPQGA